MAIPTLEQKLKWLKPTPATKHELECVSRIELGDYEIGFQRTNDILDEGMEVFVRSCRSAMGIAGDSLVGIMTADGDMVNGSCGTYLHAVIPPLIIKYILHSYRDNPGIKDGDLWFANDAVYGGIHNPDQMVAMPVFYGGELIAWTVALVHTTETGAVEPGGMPVSASARFQEGMNFPPMKIGENFRLNDDVVELFAAFGVRAPQMVAVDLKARCTTADRVRTRLIELCDKEGPDYLKGLFRKMLMMAEQGARQRLKFWPDGKYRCVTFSDAVGLNQGLVRSCYMTLIKQGDGFLVDFSGTGPETPSSYNAHPQAAIGHFANYVYEYLFHDLPISNGTFACIDFKFEPNSCLSPDVRAATSNSVMIATGVMSAVHNCVAKAMFSTGDWKQAGASQGNGGNALVLAGLSQWGMPFADMLAYSINTEGQGARPTMDGMDAFGFPWCVFGRAPDTELVENEFPLLVPLSNHWKDLLRPWQASRRGRHRPDLGGASRACGVHDGDRRQLEASDPTAAVRRLRAVHGAGHQRASGRYHAELRRRQSRPHNGSDRYSREKEHRRTVHDRVPRPRRKALCQGRRRDHRLLHGRYRVRRSSRTRSGEHGGRHRKRRCLGLDGQEHLQGGLGYGSAPCRCGGDQGAAR